MTDSIEIVLFEDEKSWDSYICASKTATPYHLFRWRDVIFNTYGYKTYSLAALRRLKDGNSDIVGILPLVHMKDFFFGNRLISIPYFDHGGIVADNKEIQDALLKHALEFAGSLNIQSIELRHLNQLRGGESAENGSDEELEKKEDNLIEGPLANAKLSVKTHKVRMLLDLPESSDALMKSFKSKLRSQVRRPQKAGLIDKVGGIELLDDFYDVFSSNMRDLGSPVHSKKFIKNVLECFPERSKIVMVYRENEPIAGSIIFKYEQLMANPWASALRKYSKESPNMLLYWSMLSYSIEQGCRFFDFGRSTPEEGTFRFKAQWGAKPHPMYWYTIWLNDIDLSKETDESSPVGKKREMAENLWRKLPLSMTRYIGPIIRKHIEL